MKDIRAEFGNMHVAYVGTGNRHLAALDKLVAEPYSLGSLVAGIYHAVCLRYCEKRSGLRLVKGNDTE
ncbi:MAG TPA: hypothetical protein VJH04_00850 [archaeon]|nr:hypothetical protein [archaeon]